LCNPNVANGITGHSVCNGNPGRYGILQRIVGNGAGARRSSSAQGERFVGALQASIFIGYRRRDSQGFAGRVADDLIEQFGAARIFRDDDIPEGADFTAVLDAALTGCQVLIVVIGPEWIHASDADGRRRLLDPEDWVRREIEESFKRGIRLLPVLVGGASMPRAEDLPDTLAPLTRIQAFEMSDRGWDEQLERLAALLIDIVPTLAPPGDEPSSPNPSTAEPLTSIGNLLGAHLKDAMRQRAVARRGSANGLWRWLGRSLSRLFWLAVLLLVGWYFLENHATPEHRQGVHDFIVFTRNKFSALMNLIG